jgi:hypothetical protein
MQRAVQRDLQRERLKADQKVWHWAHWMDRMKARHSVHWKVQQWVSTQAVEKVVQRARQ